VEAAMTDPELEVIKQRELDRWTQAIMLLMSVGLSAPASMSHRYGFYLIFEQVMRPGLTCNVEYMADGWCRVTLTDGYTKWTAYGYHLLFAMTKATLHYLGVSVDTLEDEEEESELNEVPDLQVMMPSFKC
jgi:hypothetical protein